MSESYLKTSCPKCRAENWLDMNRDDSFDGIECRLCEYAYLYPDNFGDLGESIDIFKINLPTEVIGSIGEDFDFSSVFKSDIDAKWKGKTMSELLKEYGYLEKGFLPEKKRLANKEAEYRKFLASKIEHVDPMWLRKVLFSDSNKINWQEAIDLFAVYHPELKEEIEACTAKA